jgi:hypothetical protein
MKENHVPRLTQPERKALASLVGFSAIALSQEIEDPKHGPEMMLQVTLLLELLDLEYEDFVALAAIGRELVGPACSGCGRVL